MVERTRYCGVVVGVDGSRASDVAVRWAAREAALRHVALAVVHALTAPAAGSWAFTGPVAPMPSDLLQQQEAHARAVLADAMKLAIESAVDGARPEVTSELSCSATAPTLVDLSKQAQMIVVGCRGQGALRRVLLGSVSTAVVHHAHCPVLVGIDGSAASERAIAIAFEEASLRGVELVALHAWSDQEVSVIPDIEWLAVRSAAEETLAERLAGWQEHYPDVAVRRVVVFDRPAHHLIDRSDSAQLVVVGSHGRGGFGGMLLGSVSTAVVHSARTPVIVARHH